MFCPSCGTESTIELNYCNRCGANLTANSASPITVAPINVTKPILIIGLIMLFLTLGGFAGVLSTALDLARPVGGGSKDLSIAVVFFGMITILTIDILLFRLLSKLINAALSSATLTSKKQPAQNVARLARPSTARLEPAPSVTENTTRFFDSYPPAATPERVPVKKTDQ
jgi:hypothetical protein